ncbi:hypothetical protein AGOR_G00170770 [Albula goreensis]|uniref:Mucin-15 n=1 Tax=Albula goreensis TaxID=1534307 RepID=A0A8T3D1B4_9TELE|nr:hypothetical protein AGOR_G00170770 [Albula goreensis]
MLWCEYLLRLQTTHTHPLIPLLSVTKDTMEMHFTMFTLLVLTLQAFSGVRPQDSEETQSIQPLLPNTENATGFNSLPHASGGGEPSEINWSINGVGSDAMITELPSVNVPGKDSTLAPPAVKLNGNESVPVLPGKVNGTVNGVNASSINNPDAGSNRTSKPEIRNTTQPSPLIPPKTTPASSVNNKTTSKPAIVVPVQPITQPISPKLNSTTTKPNATTTTTKLNSTTTVTKPNSTTTASNLTVASSGTTIPEATVSGNNSNRGFSGSNMLSERNGKAWGAIIGIALAVGFVGFVIYLLLKRTNRREFMHRKLVEDMPSDPVLRLDNGEPLDLKFDGTAYYNPGLQGDNIQMTNFPRGHMH